MLQRTLGRSGLEVSAIGLGTARIGGLAFSRNGDRDTVLIPEAVQECTRAIREAIGCGINFFDTADIYRAGRAEKLLGEAIRSVRHKVIIATKFGELFDEATGEETNDAVTPEYVKRACDASLRRLGTDVIDVYLFHLRSFPLDRAEGIRDALEDLVSQGKIRFYGWSTDDVERAELFAQGAHCTAIEHRLSVFEASADMLAVCEENNLASIIRAPFMTGILTGRWQPGDTLPENDRRSDWITDEPAQQALRRAESLRPILTQSGRTYVQGILAWIWGTSERAVPIPGFRTTEQAIELAGALQHGPMSKDELAAIAALMKAAR
jgi:aryl-alcohol dehydrogenase-like predicted oxidoreductase